jgi:hypothetical protein
MLLAPFALATLLAAADPAPPPLLVATPDALVFTQGDARRAASAGPATRGYRILETLADGSIVVTYTNGGDVVVEAIDPSLNSRAVSRLPRASVGFIAPSVDGFLVYDPNAQLVRRYDAQGGSTGSPAAMLGARAALGLADVNVVVAPGRLAAYDRGGRLRHESLVDAGPLVALDGKRFAVGIPSFGEVRVYNEDLQQQATLHPNGRPIRALAAAPDRAFAVLTGSESCVTPDNAVEVYPSGATSSLARITLNTGGARGIALDANAVYVAEPGCRGTNDGTIAVYGRDGSAQGTVGNVGIPFGVAPFTNARPSP